MVLEADSVQGVLFVAPNQSQPSARTLWTKLFPEGSEPDNFQSNSQAPSLPSSASGEIAGFTSRLTCQVGRVEIALTPSQVAAQQPLAKSGEVPRIADIPGAAARLASLLERAAEGFSIIRIGIVFEVSETVPMGSEGQHLRAMLPGFPFPKNALDISVQFNSRTNTSIAGLEINRLCVWASGQAGFVPAFPGQPFQLGVLPTFTPFVGIRIDVNTLPEQRPPADAVSAIISILTDEAVKISREGSARLTS